MRFLFGAILVVLALSAGGRAQAVDSGVAWGRDYTFERIEAKRAVNDKEDKGTITLVAYVYRPVKNDRREVVLFSHGSTGGLATSPKEPMGGPPVPVINFFIARGYTLVAPMRRGRNESTGTYVEECSTFTSQCTLAEQVALGERGIKEALADTNAVIDQIVLGRLVPRESKIIAGGISRGGFLSLMLAGERPKLVKGVVNFVGGWYGVTDRLTAAENDQRMADHKVRLERAARQTQVPSVWLYAARDPFYKEGVAAEFHRYWTDAGGKGEFVYFNEHTLITGHQVATNVALWGKHVDALLKTIDPAKP